MLVVETIAKIRREHFAQSKGARTIARDLGLSRNTVRKALRSGETSFDYERSEQPHRKLGLFIERLEAMLAANASAAKKDRLTLTRIADLLAHKCIHGAARFVHWLDAPKKKAPPGEPDGARPR